MEYYKRVPADILLCLQRLYLHFPNCGSAWQRTKFKFLYGKWCLIHLSRRDLVNVVNNSTCIFCDMYLENAVHLFLRCSVVTKIWDQILTWFNSPTAMPTTLAEHALCFSCLVRGKKRWKALWVVWAMTIWCI
jgi:hypothetical protein